MQAPSAQPVTTSAVEDEALVLCEPARIANADEWRSDATEDDDPEPLEEAGYGHGV
jgi:hypothetical protein